MKIHNADAKTIAKRRSCHMHECLRHVMIVCRWAGFFPVEGLHCAETSQLRFNLKAYYTPLYVATLLGQLTLTGFAACSLFGHHITLDAVSSFLFFLTSFLSGVFLMRLAQCWSKIINKAADIENRLTDIRLKSNTITKCKITAYVILVLGLVEHGLCLIYNWNLVVSCLDKPLIGDYQVLENFFVTRMPYVFEYVTYDSWIGVILSVVNVQATFLWSFMDVMISCVSIYIISFFNGLNKIIFSKEEKKKEAWERIRQNYSCLAEMVKEVDARMSHCVLLCLFTDLFFICLQLFNTLSSKNEIDMKSCVADHFNSIHSFLHILYFFYSFMFVVARVFVLSLLTANINTVAQEPISTLGEIPASVYDITIQRFYRQINYTPIAISGLFFSVTRKMILNVLGTIVTYELVLLQFSRGVQKYGNCSNETLHYSNVTLNT